MAKIIEEVSGKISHWFVCHEPGLSSPYPKFNSSNEAIEFCESNEYEYTLFHNYCVGGNNNAEYQKPVPVILKQRTTIMWYHWLIAGVILLISIYGVCRLLATISKMYPYLCIYCGKIIADKVEYNVHMKEDHGITQL